MTGAVYLVTNLVNGKYYVGQTRNLSRRLYHHAHSNRRWPFSSAIRKHGWVNFSIDVLGHAPVGRDLDDLERLWIIVSNSTDSSCGYNLKCGGSTGTASLETRKRLSISHMGKKNCLGKKRPDLAARNRARAGQPPSNKDQKMSEAQRIWISQSKQGKHFARDGAGRFLCQA